ncbi:MAG: glycosyltransferase [Bacteroidetes bacterium]|nr:glycosyltransferase [Bacteroidota bacterium]
MKILLLSDTFSEHTEKWALGLAEKGFKVGLFSFNKADYPWYNHPNITLCYEPQNAIDANRGATKVGYLKLVGVLKKAIKVFKPDILHAHYATSYGLVGALTGFHPYVISSWGTDVMRFPQKNFIAKSILKFNFRKADLLCATSNTIKKYIHAVINKPVTVIPFGVDVNVFKAKEVHSLFGPECTVIGSIKPLEPLYNNDVLLKSFALLAPKYENLRLLIIGNGTMEDSLKQLSEELGIKEKVIFTGRIPFEKISDYFNMIHILANLSEYESFGVSVIEAMACEKAVLVTNVGGLKEVVPDDSVGLKVSVGNIEETAAKLEELVINKDLCKTIGRNARQHVLKNYTWENNLEQMISEYKKLLK